MKKVIIIAGICLVANFIDAQQSQPIFMNNPYPKTITVSGSTEMEVVPDEIYVRIGLTETSQKKDITSITNTFLQQCRSVGIADSVISISSYDGTKYSWWKPKSEKENLYKKTTYQIKFSSTKQIDELIAKLDEKTTEEFYVISTSHSKIQQYRKEIKTRAIKAAKEKAKYLAEAIDEKIGEAISITEPGDNSGIPWYYYRNANVMSNNAYVGMDNSADGNTNPDFKKLKIRFEINVVFALK
jgi:uncharacterized protein